MTKAKSLIWLIVGLSFGYAFGAGRPVPDLPIVISGNENYVLIRTTPSQIERVLELAAQYCGSIPDPTSPGHTKLATPTDVPADARRTPGVMRFDCASSHR